MKKKKIKIATISQPLFSAKANQVIQLPQIDREASSINFNSFINERVTIENVVDNDRLYFDYKKAKNNHESLVVIVQGLLLESVRSNYAEYNTESRRTHAIGIPVQENY